MSSWLLLGAGLPYESSRDGGKGLRRGTEDMDTDLLWSREEEEGQ